MADSFHFQWLQTLLSSVLLPNFFRKLIPLCLILQKNNKNTAISAWKIQQSTLQILSKTIPAASWQDVKIHKNPGQIIAGTWKAGTFTLDLSRSRERPKRKATKSPPGPTRQPPTPAPPKKYAIVHKHSLYILQPSPEIPILRHQIPPWLAGWLAGARERGEDIFRPEAWSASGLRQWRPGFTFTRAGVETSPFLPFPARQVSPPHNSWRHWPGYISSGPAPSFSPANLIVRAANY